MSRHRAHIASHADIREGLVTEFADRMGGEGEVPVEDRPPPPRLQ